MRSYLPLALVPVYLVGTACGAPRAQRNGEHEDGDAAPLKNYLGTWDKPCPNIPQRQVSIEPQRLLTSEAIAENLQRRQIVSLTPSMTPEALRHTQSGQMQPWQTVQSSADLADEELVPNIWSTTFRRLGHQQIPRDGHAIHTVEDSLVHMGSEVTVETLPNGPSTIRHAPSTTRPTHFPGSPASQDTVTIVKPTLTFSAKPLDASWNAHSTLTGNPADITPSHPHTTTTTKPLTTVPASSPFGCQTTVLGTEQDPCAFQLTTHTATTTVFSAINCHGCTSVRVLWPFYECPMVSHGLRMSTATTPYTWVSTVCERVTALSGQRPTGTETSKNRRPHGAETTTTAQRVTTTKTPLVWWTSQTMEELPWFTVPDWHTRGVLSLPRPDGVKDVDRPVAE